jgi:hypothetical protein
MRPSAGLRRYSLTIAEAAGVHFPRPASPWRSSARVNPSTMSARPASAGELRPAAPLLRWCFFALSLLLGGCYAELDWRELASKEGGFSVLLPARGTETSRPLSGIAGNPVMHLWSARAADTAFGAGYANLFNADGRAAMTTLRDGLVRNFRGRIVSERNLKTGPIDSLEFVAEGSIGDAHATLNAQLLVSGARLYQLAVIGRTGAVTPADLEMFFESFRLRPPER